MGAARTRWAQQRSWDDLSQLAESKFHKQRRSCFNQSIGCRRPFVDQTYLEKTER